METGFRGTFVISWSQTEIDGQKTATTDALTVGAKWRWTGEAVRVDGPGNLLLLDGALGASDMRKRAARMVQRLIGATLTPHKSSTEIEIEEPLLDNGFVVTDGICSFRVTLIEVGEAAVPLLMFLNELPPLDTDLWLVDRSLLDKFVNRMTDQPSGLICFVAGTRLRAENGDRLVEELCEGDFIQTKDDGLQAIRWIGKRWMSGARLYAAPEYRPIRFLAGALYDGEPQEDLLVSPDHRLLMRGATTRLLYNTPEVLVAARDMVNNSGILVDYAVRDVTYYHILTERHQVVWANGVECESFHPANTSLHVMNSVQRERLLDVVPEAEFDPHTYGEYARRNLSPSEAAVMLHDAA